MDLEAVLIIDIFNFFLISYLISTYNISFKYIDQLLIKSLLDNNDFYRFWANILNIILKLHIICGIDSFSVMMPNKVHFLNLIYFC